jgi:outer membrane protein assembly factor BamB
MVALEQLVFVGLNGRVAALEKRTGEVVWEWSSGRSGYVLLLVERDCLVASVNGYLYGLDPLSGDQRWHNPLKGWGVGVASLASATQATPADAVAAAAAAQAAGAAAGGAAAAGAGS